MAITYTIISPVPGTPIDESTPLVVEVTSDTTLLRVHNGGTTFAPSFTNPVNDRSAIAGGYQFTILRDGGWPGTPTLNINACDLP